MCSKAVYNLGWEIKALFNVTRYVVVDLYT